MRMSASLQTAAFTVSNGIARIPTIFTREGVQNKGFKPFEEIATGGPTLDGRPVTFWHPKDRSRETNSEADQWIGWVSDVEARKSDKVLHGFTNIYFENAPKPYQNAPAAFQANLREGNAREGSVGYWAFAEEKPGDYGGVPYDRIEREIQFDHYAVGIPRGACSVSGGCGLGFDCDQSCTIENPIQIDGVDYIRADHFQNFIKRLGSQEFVKLADVKAAINKHLTPENQEELKRLKNALHNNGLEVNQVSEEAIKAQKRVLELETEKVQMEQKVKNLEAEAGKVGPMQEQLDTLSKTLEDLKPKITAYEAGEETKATDAETARVDLVKEVLKLRGEEETPENLEKWKAWTGPQLETMKVSLDPKLMADPAGRGIPGAPGSHPDRHEFDFPAPITQSIGNSLYGLPMPGAVGITKGPFSLPGVQPAAEPEKPAKK